MFFLSILSFKIYTVLGYNDYIFLPTITSLVISSMYPENGYSFCP